MSAAAQDNPITPKQTPSSTDPSHTSIIQTLNREIGSLKASVDWWNKTYILLLSVSIVVLIGTVFSQYKTIRLSRTLSDSQTRLDSEKDRELVGNLKAKDVDIENAKAGASAADERAGKANEAAGKANEVAGQANERAAKLELEAADALLKQRELEVRAEQLHRENLELERSFADRIFENQEATAGVLKKFSGAEAIIEYLDSPECKATAEQINFVLRMAEWNTSGRSATGLADGVRVAIEVTFPPEGIIRPTDAAVRPKLEIANAVLKEFNEHGVSSEFGFIDTSFPNATLLIRVGAKPNPLLKRDLPNPKTGDTVRGNREAILPVTEPRGEI